MSGRILILLVGIPAKTDWHIPKGRLRGAHHRLCLQQCGPWDHRAEGKKQDKETRGSSICVPRPSEKRGGGYQLVGCPVRVGAPGAQPGREGAGRTGASLFPPGTTRPWKPRTGPDSCSPSRPPRHRARRGHTAVLRGTKKFHPWI